MYQKEHVTPGENSYTISIQTSKEEESYLKYWIKQEKKIIKLWL